MTTSAVVTKTLTRLAEVGRPPTPKPKTWPTTPPTHSLSAAERDHDRLAAEGTLVIAGVARVANALLAPGDTGQLAAVVFSPPWKESHRIGRVVDVATHVGSELERSLASLGEWPSLTNVPPRLTHGDTFLVTTIWIERKAIPRGILTASWIPVLVHPDTAGVIPLPCSLWAPDLTEAFTRWGGF